MKRFVLCCAVMVLAIWADADPKDGKSMSAVGPAFRRFSQVQYGKWLPTWMNEREKTREGYRVWMELPCGRDEEAKALTQFIVDLIVRTNNVAATYGKKCRPIESPIRTVEAAIAYRRDMCFAQCEEVDVPTGGMLRGVVDFADDRYVCYTVTENCWYMGNNCGEFVTAHGVYDRKRKRVLGLADFFQKGVMERVAAALREGYASAVRGDRYDTWAEFRKRYPKNGVGGHDLMDPIPNENFTCDDSGMTWSFDDSSTVGWQERRQEDMLDVSVSWRTLRKFLADRSAMPVVNSIWDRDSDSED